MCRQNLDSLWDHHTDAIARDQAEIREHGRELSAHRGDFTECVPRPVPTGVYDEGQIIGILYIDTCVRNVEVLWHSPFEVFCFEVLPP